MAGLRVYRRFVVVAWHFLPLLLAYARDRHRFLIIGPSRSVDPATQRERAALLLESFLTLGPTFVKLGQLLSTRPDVLPPAYIDELSKLQDRVPPAPWPSAREVVEEELGPLDERFTAFETEAISGASLGQVYLAEIDGQAVAVKVRRPGVEALVEADLRVVSIALTLLLPFIDDARSFSLENLASEFSQTIRQEMDYIREANMLAEIRENFAEDERIVIPSLIESHSSERVLTMEYIPGTKINDVDELDDRGIDRSAVAETLQRAYLKMIIDDGVFHADPHPGNLAVKPDGRIVFYDFGMSGRVDPFVQERIVDFYVAAANEDIDSILDVLTELGTLSPTADRRVMGQVMELAIEDARGEQIEQYRIQQIISQIENTIYEFPFRLPSNLALVLRVATVVEGVCVTLDPDFDFIEVSTAYLREEGYREETARRIVSETSTQIREAGWAALRTPPKLERTLDRLDRENLAVRIQLEDPDALFAILAKRIVYGLLLSVGLVSTAIVYSFRGLEPAAVPALASFAIALLLYWSFRSRRGIRARPQFTRQGLRERRERE